VSSQRFCCAGLCFFFLTDSFQTRFFGRLFGAFATNFASFAKPKCVSGLLMRNLRQVLPGENCEVLFGSERSDAVRENCPCSIISNIFRPMLLKLSFASSQERGLL
jgi:hypothetical protein